MVVTARAGDRKAHERHGHVFGERNRVLVQHEIVCRAVGERVARRVRISRAIRSQACWLPRSCGSSCSRTTSRSRQAPARDQQQIGPLVGPVVHELRPREQRVDQLHTLVRRLVREKRPDLFCRRQDAGDIQKRARRMNSASDESGDGSMFSSASFASTRSSMKLARGARAYTAGSMPSGKGDVIRAVTRRLRYHAEMAASPGPFTVTAPR